MIVRQPRNCAARADRHLDAIIGFWPPIWINSVQTLYTTLAGFALAVAGGLGLLVGLPRSMPCFFGSLKVAITLAFVASVISETIAANAGLGHMMLAAQSRFNVPLVFAGLMMLAFQGIAMSGLMAWIEKRTAGWAHRSAMAQGN